MNTDGQPVISVPWSKACCQNRIFACSGRSSSLSINAGIGNIVNIPQICITDNYNILCFRSHIGFHTAVVISLVHLKRYSTVGTDLIYVAFPPKDVFDSPYRIIIFIPLRFRNRHSLYIRPAMPRHGAGKRYRPGSGHFQFRSSFKGLEHERLLGCNGGAENILVPVRALNGIVSFSVPDIDGETFRIGIGSYRQIEIRRLRTEFRICSVQGHIHGRLIIFIRPEIVIRIGEFPGLHVILRHEEFTRHRLSVIPHEGDAFYLLPVSGNAEADKGSHVVEYQFGTGGISQHGIGLPKIHLHICRVPIILFLTDSHNKVIIVLSCPFRIRGHIFAAFIYTGNSRRRRIILIRYHVIITAVDSNPVYIRPHHFSAFTEPGSGVRSGTSDSEGNGLA